MYQQVKHRYQRIYGSSKRGKWFRFFRLQVEKLCRQSKVQKRRGREEAMKTMLKK